MPYRDRIAKLREEHQRLNAQVDRLEREHLAEENGGVSAEHLSELKKKRLQYLDEIRRLERLQYEERLRIEWDNDE